VFQHSSACPFDTVVGIDQTSRPKPLPLVVLSRDESGWVLDHRSLKALTPKELLAQGIPALNSRTWISADCVLWVFHGEGEQGMWRTLAEAAAHQGGARDFFKAHQGGRDLRHVDQLARAQSVFRELPYQRNIQSGTFRVWSEIGGHRWLNLWPFCQTANPDQAWLAEAYPTYFWKQHFNTKRRDPALLARFLDEIPSKWMSVSDETKQQLLQPDYADAAILCLSTFALLTLEPEWISIRERFPREEGWIFGVKEDPS